MPSLTIEPTALKDVIEITPVRHGDSRGWFSETWNKAQLAHGGIEIEWVQDNESLSSPAGTLRGVHFQLPPHAQDKLVRVISGSILDVAVDLRRDSATFGQHVAVTLSAERGNQLLVPKGFGHAFCTLEDDCRVAYKVSASYAPDCDRSIRYDDADLAIKWPFTPDKLVLSSKDEFAPSLDELRTASDLF